MNDAGGLDAYRTLDALGRMIERLTSQRACLDRAADMVAGIDGPVLEFGLGKGRTFDYLRHRMPGREIFAFDREVHAPAQLVPDTSHLIVGEFALTISAAVARFAGTVALAHCDCGGEDSAAEAAVTALVATALLRLLRPGAIAVHDRPGPIRGMEAMPLPPGMGVFPYYMYRRI